MADKEEPKSEWERHQIIIEDDNETDEEDIIDARVEKARRARDGFPNRGQGIFGI